MNSSDTDNDCEDFVLNGQGKKSKRFGKAIDVAKKMNIQSHETGNDFQNRRPRKEEEFAKFHESSFSYRVRIITDGNVAEVPVCCKAFLSLHGITKKKVEVLQKSLKMTRKAPTAMRGKHFNRPQKLKPDAKQQEENRSKIEKLQLRKKKAAVFHERENAAKLSSRANSDYEAISMSNMHGFCEKSTSAKHHNK
ncbi:unnamed protein product [Psylliodes chrysocephalus]|uniref:Uncharacterized protein n=1 Tax=Psylliodes chrysocephalus TaxID=3402493 RepID=A0A9P0GNU1_9CUCU|nr:unnamed protein product [Psylliodes chrysocephala]